MGQGFSLRHPRMGHARDEEPGAFGSQSERVYKPMVLVYDKPGTLLVFYRLNSAIERGTKPDA